MTGTWACNREIIRLLYDYDHDYGYIILEQLR